MRKHQRDKVGLQRKGKASGKSRSKSRPKKEVILGHSNVRGMQQLRCQAAIVDFVRRHKIDVIGLLEMKLKANNYSYLMKNKFKEWRNVDNFDKSDRSKMLLLWIPSRVELELINVDVQTIHTKIRCLMSNNSFYFTLVYGNHTIPDRRSLWDSLIEFVPQDEPTLVSRDFNNVMADDERVEGIIPSEYEVKNMVINVHNSDLKMLCPQAAIHMVGRRYFKQN